MVSSSAACCLSFPGAFLHLSMQYISQCRYKLACKITSAVPILPVVCLSGYCLVIRVRLFRPVITYAEKRLERCSKVVEIVTNHQDSAVHDAVKATFPALIEAGVVRRVWSLRGENTFRLELTRYNEHQFTVSKEVMEEGTTKDAPEPAAEHVVAPQNVTAPENVIDLTKD